MQAGQEVAGRAMGALGGLQNSFGAAPGISSFIAPTV